MSEDTLENKIARTEEKLRILKFYLNRPLPFLKEIITCSGCGDTFHAKEVEECLVNIQTNPEDKIKFRSPTVSSFITHLRCKCNEDEWESI